MKFVTRPPAAAKPSQNDGRRVLALRLDEHELIAPQIRHAVHDGLVEPAAHRRRAGDRKRTGALRDARLDPDDGLGAVARGRDAGVGELLRHALIERNISRAIHNSHAHYLHELRRAIEGEPSNSGEPPA